MIALSEVLVADDTSGLCVPGEYRLFPDADTLKDYVDKAQLHINEDGIYCLRIFLDDLIDRLGDGDSIYDIVTVAFTLYDDATEWYHNGQMSPESFALVRDAIIGAIS